MASSDSEGFESADEGHGDFEKATRKHRKSSSNYSDNVIETTSEEPKTTAIPAKDVKALESTDGWGDFDIEEPESTGPKRDQVSEKINMKSQNETSADDVETQGWDNFGDWGDDGGTEESKSSLPEKMSNMVINNQSSSCIVNQSDTNNQKKDTSNQNSGADNQSSGTNTQSSGTNTQSSGTNNISSGTNNISSGTNNLSTGTNNQSSGANNSWGWGWGMDSLLTTATAGISSISTLTTQVSQGLTTVLDSTIGAPNPEELARRPAPTQSEPMKENIASDPGTATDDDDFPFGSILKLVGSTGSKVISGGLDTLETIGRKTMEVLQDGDPRLARKRALLNLNDRPVLSTLLREAAAKADEQDKLSIGKREAREVHYENLFDDFEGLVHLEALEMVSRQTSLRIEDRLRDAAADQRTAIRETLTQVEELCEIQDDEDDDDDYDDDSLLDKLQKATEDLGVKLQFQPLVKQHNDIIEFLNDDNITLKAVYKHAITSLAQATALSMEIYHKTAEMLLVKPRRSTADEADGLTQLTIVLSKHMRDLARIFTEKLNVISKDSKKHPNDKNTETEGETDANGYVTNVFLEAENSCKYLQNALVLELPIIQIGAV